MKNFSKIFGFFVFGLWALGARARGENVCRNRLAGA